MVFLKNALMNKFRNKTFIDKIRVYVRGGNGGHGMPRLGGQGGRGGQVYVVGKEKSTLKNIVRTFPKKRFIADPGNDSKARSMFGEPGIDVEISAPLGIIVKNDAGRVLGEINEAGDKVLVAKGGAGGSRLNGFKGQKGHVQSVTLDLQLIADIGLVGFPNAGKSTLLSAVSRASPKIASYPFTTIQPQLGTMMYEDQRQITMADLPGLIEGAHINIGMGHSFLKHIERTKLLLFVIDIHGFQLGHKHPVRSALENVALLNRELELYKEELVHKPAILALNKIDTEGGEVLADELKTKLTDKETYLAEVDSEFHPSDVMKFDDVLLISAKKRMNIDYLKERLRKLLDLYVDENLDKTEVLKREIDIVKSNLMEHRGSKLV